MDVPQLKEYVLFDQFRKARAYFLEIEEKSNEPIEIAIAKNFSSLYEQRKNVGCVVDDTVYIFGAERYNALSPTSYWLTPEHTGKKAIDGTRLSPKGVNVFKDAQKEAKENLGISLEIKPIYPYKNQESLKTLPEDVKNVFSFKAKNQKVATNEANSRIWIDQGYIVLSLKRINPRS